MDGPIVDAPLLWAIFDSVIYLNLKSIFIHLYRAQLCQSHVIFQQMMMVHSFIYSLFILAIPIAPLQVHYYSEALQTTALMCVYIRFIRKKHR